jgi:hypothetical protein
MLPEGAISRVQFDEAGSRKVVRGAGRARKLYGQLGWAAARDIP